MEPDPKKKPASHRDQINRNGCILWRHAVLNGKSLLESAGTLVYQHQKSQAITKGLILPTDQEIIDGKGGAA